MFTSTREYKKFALSNVLDHLPRSLAGIVLEYVTAPGVDLLAAGLAATLSDITIIDPKLKPRGGQSAGRVASRQSNTDTHVCVRITITQAPLAEAEPIRQLTISSFGSTVTYCIPRNGDFRNETYLRINLPDIAGYCDRIDVQMSHDDLWDFICGDDSITAPLIRRRLSSAIHTTSAIDQVRKQMKAIVTTALAKK